MPARKPQRKNQRKNKRRGRRPRMTTAALVKVRAPIIETKKRTTITNSSQQLSQTGSAHFIRMESYMTQERGLGYEEFVGRSIFPKYYSQKVKFILPRGDHSIIENFKVEVIHGWMTAPYALDNEPLSPGLSKENVSKTELLNLIYDRIAQDFDSSSDDMIFRDKRKNIYRILGRQFIRPDRNSGIGLPQQTRGGVVTGQNIVGGAPSVKIQLNWKCGFKMRLTDSTGMGSVTPGPADPFSYPNASRIPFVCIYTPDFATGYPQIPDPADPSETINDPLSKIQVVQSDCLWYSDS